MLLVVWGYMNRLYFRKWVCIILCDYLKGYRLQCVQHARTSSSDRRMLYVRKTSFCTFLKLYDEALKDILTCFVLFGDASILWLPCLEIMIVLCWRALIQLICWNMSPSATSNSTVSESVPNERWGRCGMFLLCMETCHSVSSFCLQVMVLEKSWWKFSVLCRWQQVSGLWAWVGGHWGVYEMWSRDEVRELWWSTNTYWRVLFWFELCNRQYFLYQTYDTTYLILPPGHVKVNCQDCVGAVGCSDVSGKHVWNVLLFLLGPDV